MGLKQTGVELIASGASSFNGDIDRANRAVTDFGRDAEQSAGGISRFGEIATGALRQVGVVAVEMGMQAARAIAGFVSDSISVASDYESSLNRFASVAGSAVTNAGMAIEDFSDLALEMGAKTQFSAGQAADAMVELAKGGLDPATIAAGGLEGALNLAAAGELDLSEAANITAKQLGVWGDAGVTAAQIADRLAQAANASTVDVDELAVGMANVGGVAKIAGLSFDETTQTLALLAPGFSSAADASTSMKTFLTRLIPATDKAAGAMSDLGLMTKEGTSKFYDATGAFIGMEAASQLLYEQTKDLTEAQRLSAFQTIFGADAIRAASMIAEAGAAGFNAMGAAMTNAGTATEQAAARNQGFAFAMESLKGSIETVQIVLGTMLLPILTDFITNYVTPAINGVLAFAQAFSDSGDKLGFVTAQVTAIFPELANLWTMLQAGVETVRTVVLPILEDFANWLQGPGTDVVEEYAAFYISNWQQIYGIVQAILPSIQSIIETVLSAIQIFIDEHGEEIMATLQSAWDTIKEIYKLALQIIEATVVPAFRAIAAFIADHKTEIVSILEGAWEIIKNVIDGALTLIKGILTAALQIIHGDWDGAWETIKQTVIDVWANIRGIIDGAIKLVTTILQTGWDIIKGAVTTAWNAIQSAIETPLLLAQATAQAVINTILGYVNGAIDKINALITLINAVPGVNIPTIPTVPSSSGVGMKSLGGRVSPPASGGQLAQQALVQSLSTVNNWNYSPSYGGAPANPSQDFYMMRALVR